MERSELVRRIRLGEDSTLELKRVLLAGFRITAPKRDEFADELAGMANGWGGTVVLGVEDRSREILGIPLDRLDAVETWVREICNDSVKPPLDALVRKIDLPGADGNLLAVLCVEIARSLFVHKSPGGYFRRIGSSKRELTPEVLARALLQTCRRGEGSQAGGGVRLMFPRWPDGPVATRWPRSEHTVRRQRRARRSLPRQRCPPAGQRPEPGPCAALASPQSP